MGIVWAPLAQIGLDSLSSHHDTRLILLRGVDLLLWLVGEGMRAWWEEWEAIERGKACVAAIGISELDRRICRV